MQGMHNERIFVGVGGNKGDALAIVRRAIQAMQHWPQERVVAVSSPYRTRPVDAEGGDFVNAVVELRSEREPEALLSALLALEARLGRRRVPARGAGTSSGAPGVKRYAARTIDLDLLTYGDRIWHSATLRLPHPRMHTRAFVLVPLAELAPDHPLPDGRTVARALPDLPDRHEVTRLEIRR